MQLVVSNGHGLFPLRTAAAEAIRNGVPAALLTGAYPTPLVKRVLAGLGLAGGGGARRLLAREDAIPIDRVYPLWLSEPIAQLGSTLGRLAPSRRLGDRTTQLARAVYARRASAVVRRLPLVEESGIYHYRSGYGGRSVAVARDRGLIALCDHSIAHPAVLDHLIAHDGQMPPAGSAGTVHGSWRAVAADLARADHVLVNSHFVRDTFLHQGWDPARLHVIYSGVDERFLAAVPAGERSPVGPLRLLFAGAFSARKGAPEVAAALAGLAEIDWRLDICGHVDPALAGPLGAFLSDHRVRHHGSVGREALAAHMSTAEVFLFPSRAEGSARVVFEALAAGCVVVTTPNAGSIVGSDAQGLVVPPGDPATLQAALRDVAARRAELATIGRQNAAIVRDGYRERHYGAALLRLYEALMTHGAGTGR